MFKKILVTVDGSDTSEKALGYAVQLCQSLGAGLVVMTVAEGHPGAVHGAAVQANDNPMHQAAQEASQFWLQQAQQRVTALGGSAKTLLIRNDSVYQGILDGAKAEQADLIIMARSGAGALARLLLGSQTHQVLSHTNIPVLVVQ